MRTPEGRDRKGHAASRAVPPAGRTTRGRAKGRRDFVGDPDLVSNPVGLNPRYTCLRLPPPGEFKRR